MTQTKWDVYEWMKAELEFEGKVPTEKEVQDRYEQKGYSKEIIDKGYRMYHEINK